MKKLLTAALCAISFTANAASIIGLGDLPGGSFFSIGLGISADGSTVVGQSRSALGLEAFIYQNGVIAGLGQLNESSRNSEARGVSADGSIVVGSAGAEAFIYQNGVLTGLGDLFDDSSSSAAWGISDDGSTVVGTSRSASGFEAFIYQNGVVMTGTMGLAGGFNGGIARAASADGSTIVGGRSLDVSADGSIIVGSAFTASGTEAFIDQNGVMTGLGQLPDSHSSFASGVSADGSTVVGWSAAVSEDVELVATLWSEDGSGGFNIESLQDRLLLLGIDTTADGWTSLVEAFDISADGRFIAGTGRRNGNEEAFLVDLGTTAVPVPAAAWLFGSALIGLFSLKRKSS